MNLSFPPIDKGARSLSLPAEFAVMLVGIAARQAASPTALFQSRIAHNPVETGLLAPAHGAFSEPVALLLRETKEE